jgi:hypothetical protein
VFCEFVVSAGAPFEFVSPDVFAPGALAGADDVEPPVGVTSGAEFCGIVPLAPPPIGLEMAEAGVIPAVPIGLEMAEAGVIPVVPIGFEAGIIPGMGAPVVCGPTTLVSPGNGVFVAVGPVMVTPGMFVFPTVPFTAVPGVVRSAEPDIGTALVGVPRALLPLCTGRPVVGPAFVGEPFTGLPLAEVPLPLLGLLLLGLRGVGEPLEPFDCATIQDAAARKKIRSAVFRFMVGNPPTFCVMFEAKRPPALQQSSRDPRSP